MKKTFNKMLSLVLSVVMAFGVLVFTPIENAEAYTSHSRDEAVAWAKSKIGSKIDVDGAYGAQCVDLIMAYYQYLGVSRVSGNGCDYSHNSLPSGWTRIQNTASFVPNPGDIVVWTDEGWKNGHVAIFLSGNTSNFTSIDQNWPQGSEVKEVYHSSYKYVWGVIRPDFSGGSSDIFYGLSKVDRGTDFYGYIIRNENWASISDENGDVRVNNNGNIVWYFTKTSDGGYKIKNVATGKYLDVDGARDEDNNNVQTWEQNDSDAQVWYIYGPWSGEYVFKPKCTSNKVLNVYGPTGDTTTWTFDPDDKDMRFALWELDKPGATTVSVSPGTHYTPTSFSWNATDNTDHYDVKIWKGTYWQGDAYLNIWNVKDTSCLADLPEGYYEAYVDSVNSYACTMSQNVVKFNVTSGKKVDIGNNVYGYIIRNWKTSYISDVNNKVCVKNDGNKLWYFTKTDDGGYKIKNVATGKYLDVKGAKDENGCEVQTYTSNDSAAQVWYIYGRWSGEYYLKPKCTSNKVLDIYSSTDEAHIWEIGYRSQPQTFAIKTLSNWTVTYNMNGGSGSIENQTKVADNTLILCSTKPTRTGYSFVCWNTKSDGTGTNYNPSGKYTANSGTTLYAIWKINTWTVSYNMNGGSGSIANQTKTYGQDLTLSSTKPTRTGYEFVGWNTDKNATTAQYQPGGKYTANSGATLYAIWKINTWTVSYNMNGGSGSISNQTKTYGQDLTLSSTKPTRTGYDFLGWSTDKNATTAQYQSGGKYTANSGATLYAIWKINTWTVSYNMNGGSGSISNQTKTYGQDLTLSSTKPTRTGYEFVGWNTDKNATTAQYQPGDKYTAESDAVLYAIWKIKVPSEQPVITGLNELYNVGDNITINWNKVDRSTSYRVEIWRNPGTEAEKIIDTTVTSNSYTLNNVIPGKHSVWIYAINSSGSIKSEKYWCFVPYTIRYDLNGGTGTISPTSKIQFEDCTLSCTIPTRTDYDFLGWSTKKDAATAQYQPGDKYTAESDTVLYAIWRKALKNTSLISGETATAGSIVSMIGNAENGTAPYTYAFYYKRSVNTKWNVIGTEFGTAKSATFKPTAAADYDIKVVVKDADGKTAEKLFKLTVVKGLTNTSWINAEKVQIGDDIRVTGAAEGGSGGYKYAFYFKRSANSKWNKIGTEFGTKTYGITIPQAAVGYDMKVIVKDSEGNTAEKIFKVTVVESLPLTNISFLSAYDVPVGKTVTAAGRFVGGARPCTYEFYFKRTANTKWNKLSYGSSAGTYAKFTPTAAASYDIKVIAIDSKGTKASKVMTISAS